MEAMIRGKFADIDGSIQKVQASLVEIHENIGMLVAEEKERLNIKWNIKQGVVHAIFNIDDVPNVGGGSISSKNDLLFRRKLVAGCLQTKEGPSLGAFLRHTPVTSRHCSLGIREKDQDEIELKEVFAEEFLHLLKVIYPPFDDADVTPNNVEILRCLADRYQVKLSCIGVRNTPKSVRLANFPWEKSWCTHKIIIFWSCWSTALTNARQSMI
uniref:Uncharacterized protein n=1 Tax=Ditylenchus dipsaci TaxID=166011 RepID=A0A915DJT7_9BILA